ncbi:hypothetical protein QT971_15565, partial [Microcoleus sp. herbarium19]|uniref:hypothetical protein n=1 Tax=Microcoleus sp. herbarium19 TaxID=3055440 RepID=UPI002FCE9795
LKAVELISNLKLADIILNEFMIAQSLINPLPNLLQPPYILMVLRIFAVSTLLGNSFSFLDF